MTRILLAFPRAERTRLSCKWIETGNPRRPLVCVWADKFTGKTTAEPETALAADGGRLRSIGGHLCA